MSNNDAGGEVRFCKKCGCELVSTNKRKLCDNCRREHAGKIRNVGLIGVGILGAVLSVITKGKHGGGDKA